MDEDTAEMLRGALNAGEDTVVKMQAYSAGTRPPDTQTREGTRIGK